MRVPNPPPPPPLNLLTGLILMTSYSIARHVSYCTFLHVPAFSKIHFSGGDLMAGRKPATRKPPLRTYCANAHTHCREPIPEKELRDHNPNFHIHASVSDLYIPMIDLPILLQDTCGPILEIFKSLTDKRMWKLGMRPHNSQKRNTSMGFSLQCKQLSIRGAIFRDDIYFDSYSSFIYDAQGWLPRDDGD